MQINKIEPNFTSARISTGKSEQPDYLKMFHDRAKNSADMTDSILVPRTIFKGYLGIMTGTTLITIGSLLSKHSKISKPFSIGGLIASLYGTWAFVRPFIIKDTNGVQTSKDVLSK